MALLNDIKKMQSEGKTEQEIISVLRQQGVSAREIVEALSQSKIKEAVAGEPEAPTPYAASQQAQQEPIMPMPGTDVIPQQAQEMQPSPQPMPAEQAMQYPSPQQAQPQPAQGAYPEYQQYQQYQPAPAGISPDTITEISEQVVSEKLSPLRKDIERVIDLKTTMESKLEYLDDRLKRIEKIIDRLNLSIMQKVGDYMTNIEDIKKEIVETQKSFKALAPSLETKEKPEKPKKSQE